MPELAWPRKLPMLLRRQKMVNCLVGWNWLLHKMQQLHQYLILFEIGCLSKVLRDFLFFLGFLSPFIVCPYLLLPLYLNIYCVYCLKNVSYRVIVEANVLKCFVFFPLILDVKRPFNFCVHYIAWFIVSVLVSYNFWMSSDHSWVCLLYWPFLSMLHWACGFMGWPVTQQLCILFFAFYCLLNGW